MLSSKVSPRSLCIIQLIIKLCWDYIGGAQEMRSQLTPYIELARLIGKTRQAQKLSQRRLSSLLKMSPAYAAQLESGRIQPSVKTLNRIASTLKIPYRQLALLAGYIYDEVDTDSIKGEYAERLNEIRDLTRKEWESVLDFACYIRSKRGIH